MYRGYGSKRRRRSTSTRRRTLSKRRSRRGIRRVRGQGSYWGYTLGGALGGIGGGVTGGPMGAVAGVGAGAAAGDWFGNVVGLGDYTVKSNSLVMDEGAQVPAFGDLSDAVIVKHREFIQDIVVPASPGTFNNISFRLNPGEVATFPWLQNIAQNFDTYMLLGAIFEYRSTSADVGSTSTLGMGTIIMATDYDAHDAAYTNKISMENSQYTTSCRPSTSCSHIIECDPSVTVQPHLYVRHGALGSSEDARFYDHGLFQIATTGLPAGSSGTIGELWVTYQVAFFKPQLPVVSSSLSSGSTMQISGTTGITSSVLLGTNFVTAANSANLGTWNGTNVFLFNPAFAILNARLIYVYSVFGASTSLAVGITTILTDCVNEQGFNNATGGNSTVHHLVETIRVTGSAPRITFNSGWTVPTTPTKARLYIVFASPDVNSAA